VKREHEHKTFRRDVKLLNTSRPESYDVLTYVATISQISKSGCLSKTVVFCKANQSSSSNRKNLKSAEKC
jgi:hypothetical protein